MRPASSQHAPRVEPTCAPRVEPTCAPRRANMRPASSQHAPRVEPTCAPRRANMRPASSQHAPRCRARSLYLQRPRHARALAPDSSRPRHHPWIDKRRPTRVGLRTARPGRHRSGTVRPHPHAELSTSGRVDQHDRTNVYPADELRSYSLLISGEVDRLAVVTVVLNTANPGRAGARSTEARSWRRGSSEVPG